MYKIVFVILHFETLNDTRTCIDSLLKQTYSNIEIIVVDNGSKNEKANSVRIEYSDYPHIYFIESEQNLGFAKGNNLGFRYAKEELKADFIVLCNSDLVFEQCDFTERLAGSYRHEAFDIAGPRIISFIDGMNQNPVRRLFRGSSDADKRLGKLYVLYFLSIFHLDLVLRREISNSVKEYHMKEGQDFQLHGACLIFSPAYIGKYDGLFADTFMYGEEDILKLRAEQDQLVMKYIDEIEVKHKEGSSTKKVFSKSLEQRRFFYKWSIDSTRKLKALYKALENRHTKNQP